MAEVDLRRTSIFVRVVEAGTFSAAATALRLPTSSVSRSVAGLEEELGVRLLHRTSRKLTLTDAGHTYFGRMQAVLAEANEATQEVINFGGDPHGLVRLTAPVDLGVLFLPPMIATLSARHPRLAIELSLTSRRVDLVEEGFDLAIRGAILEDSSLVARKVKATDLGVFAAPAYIERRGRPRTVADVAGHDCVVYRTRGGKVPWRLTGPRGVETADASGPVAADDMLFVRELVLQGAGLALLPEGIVAAEVADGRLVRVLPKHAMSGGALYLVWPSRRLLPARVALVRDFLADALASRL
jgi:DNA-binding transcriptional LysR family regulator